VRIGVLQLEPRFGKVKENVERAKSLLSRCRDATVVLPELFNTGYVFRSKSEVVKLAELVRGGFTTTELTRVAVDQKLNLVFGMAEKSGGKIFNTAVLVRSDGTVESYQKLHLFNREKLFFTPGNKPPAVHRVAGARLGMLVCFDWVFPEVSRVLALKGAQILCHPSNLVLPWCQDAMKTRTIENQVFAVTANRVGTERGVTFTGRSQIAGPDGTVLAGASKKGEALKVVEIDPKEADRKRITPNNDLFADRRPKFYRMFAR